MNKIVWEKYKDPFNRDKDDSEWMHSGDKREEDQESQPYKDQYEESQQLSQQEEIDFYEAELRKNPYMLTSLGAIPVTEYTNPAKIFKFHTGHTNFRITQLFSELIQEIDGVETYDVFTPYRFRIAVGHAFDSQLVKNDINKMAQNAIRQEKRKDWVINNIRDLQDG